MRVDLFLKISRLVKRRTHAQELCESGRVLINGNVAKPSKDLKQDDELTINFSSRSLVLEVLTVDLSKKTVTSSTPYRIISETRTPQREPWTNDPLLQ